MKLQAETEVVVAFLRAAIEEQPFHIGERDVSWEKIEKLLDFHKIKEMAYYGALRAEDRERIPDELLERMKRASKLATMKETHQHFALEEIREAFEREEIRFVPLKGCVLKYMYPIPQMRTMSDLDILYKEEQLNAVRHCLSELGYELEEEQDVHDVYVRKPFMHIEMHKCLVNRPEKQKQYFDLIWERLRPAEGKAFEHEMTPEDYYLLMIAHMAKHFANGGTGLRSLADFHVMRRRQYGNADRTVVKKQLEKLELLDFEKALTELDESVFGGAPWKDGALEQSFEYMISSGIYGTVENFDRNYRSDKERAGNDYVTGRFDYIKSMIFLNRQGMEQLYPWLRGRGYLLVPAWIYRIFHRLIFRRKEGMKVVNGAKGYTEKLFGQQEVLKRVGLRK